MEQMKSGLSDHSGPHGEGCSCGCHDHDHDHHHDHDHGHHHGHDHEHAVSKTMACARGSLTYSLSAHEEANIVSCAIEMKSGESLAVQELSDAMQDLAVGVEAAGGVVGHIKCAASGEAGSLHISTTSASQSPTIKASGLELLDEECDISLVVIAVIIERSSLEELVLRRMGELLA